MKIVIIGAGSLSFGRGQITDILSNQELKSKNIELWLVDKDVGILEIMVKIAERIKEFFKSDARICSSICSRDALPEADYVMLSIAEKRMELWEQDFRIPLAYGFRHCLGENGGPGALFHALRSMKLVIPVCREIEELCPDAILLNFTNPEARVLNAIQTLTKVNAFGLCHGVFSAIECVERLLERSRNELDYTFAGMNHFYTLLELKDKSTGQDLKEELFRRVKTDTSGSIPPLFRKMVEIYGIFSYPSDDHIGEYLPFGAEYHGIKWPYGLESRKLTRNALTEFKGGTSDNFQRSRNWTLLEEYANGKRPIDDGSMLLPSGEVAANIIAAIENDESISIPSVNTLNRDELIVNLPEYGVVEIPAVADGKGIHPREVGSVPENLAVRIHVQFQIHRLIVEAYASGSKDLLLQALILDPLVNSIGNAGKMLDEMLKLQAEFLPDFK